MKLSRGRKEPCKDNIGGIKELYLMTYVDYDIRSIVGYRDSLITSFPVSQIYKYEGQQKTFNETYNEEGYYSLELNFNLVKQDLATSLLLSILTKNKVRAVVVDWKGETKIAGIINGLDVDISTRTGGVKSDFNGYEVTLTGREEFSSPFVISLDDVGITQKQLDIGCILASTDRGASMSDIISSCNSLTSKQITFDCLKASSSRLTSMNQLISSCNISV